jgi:MYXO-CTERM domain-containing protein
MARGGVAALALAGALAVTAHAGAYCRQKACDNLPAYDDVWQTTPDPPCERDEFLCLLEGTPLHWPATCISYGIQKDGSVSDGIDLALATSVIDDAFAKWQAADCGGEPPSLVVKNLGAITCNRREYNQDQGNANLFLFRDKDWPYTASEGTALAFTWLTYNTETAEIYNVDVEINSFTLNLTVAEPPLVQWDLSAILTHEIGHFLGLGHSGDASATMWWQYDQNSIEQRSLEPDDEAGICEIYPPGRKVGAACEPRHGFSRDCATKDTGCSVAPGGSKRSIAGLLALGLAVAAARRIARLSSKRRAPRR